MAKKNLKDAAKAAVESGADYKVDHDIAVNRFGYHAVQTIGDGIVYKDRKDPIFYFKTMELEQDKNEKRDDCIPPGLYPYKKHKSPKFGECIWIQKVPNRSEILMHPANYSRQLLGCIAPGKEHKDIDGDGLVDVTSSKSTMNQILKLIPSKGYIRIV